jgi:chloramphenicol 3-O phosphotransferase
VHTQVIVLNGASSSGKSSIARCLQSILSDPWLTLGVDTLIQAMPLSMHGLDLGLRFEPDGQVIVGNMFRQLEAAWYQGLASVAHAGAGVIVDEVFLDGTASQDRLRVALDGLQVFWVGVRCDRAIAAAREAIRDDRTDRKGDAHPGMAKAQADAVHRGVRYDLEVDTTTAAAMDCARAVARHVGGPGTN